MKHLIQRGINPEGVFGAFRGYVETVFFLTDFLDNKRYIIFFIGGLDFA
jgi:hypothetical protein